MRTAKEIIKANYPFATDGYWINAVVVCINDARKEVIEECAKRAEVDGFCESGDSHCVVDESSILNIIKELK